MRISVNGKGKNLTDIDIKDKPVKKKEENTAESNSEFSSLSEQRALTMNVCKKEGVLKSIKNGITTSFAVPFGLALGLSPTIVTFLTSIPQLLGSVSVLFIENLIGFFHRRKRLMVMASYMESYTWLLVLAMAALSIRSPWLLIALVTLDAIFMNIQYPIWNSIMGDTVPNNILGKYFGVRSLLVGISSLASVIIAGIALNRLADINPMLGFGLVFGVSFIAAFAATKYQSKMIDPNPQIKKDTKHSFKEFLFTIKDNNFGLYTGFFAMFQMVVYIAAPFYTIYMLEVLKFDYLTFTIITIASAVSSLASMRAWGKLVDKYGSKKIMSITSFLIPGAVLLWIFTKNWKILTLVEIYSGIVWAGFNLSCSAFMYESVKPEHKVKFYTYNKVLFGVGVFIGTMIGVLLINMPPVIFSSSILLIFLVSGILRIAVAIIFIPLIKEEKVVTITFKGGHVFGNLITLRPKGGPQFEVIPSYTVPEPDEIKKAKIIKNEKEKSEQKTRKLPPRIPPKMPPRSQMISENQKKDKTKQILTTDNEKKNRNPQKGSLEPSQGMGGNKPGIYNNSNKPTGK
jgi:MFS family permease